MDTFPDVRSKQSMDLAAAAKARADQKHISIAEALIEIARENPAAVAGAYEELLHREIVSCGWPNHHETIYGSKIGERLSEMARKRSAEKNISFRVGLGEIGNENRDLWRAHREQVIGEKP